MKTLTTKNTDYKFQVLSDVDDAVLFTVESKDGTANLFFGQNLDNYESNKHTAKYMRGLADSLINVATKLEGIK
jgi:hypothetical protein